MAGAVRQPIDIEALSQYLDGNVKGIALPIQVKQVSNEKPFLVIASLTRAG